MTRYCSLPQFGNIRKWFEKNFHNCCEFHDKLYAAPAKVSRLIADIMLVKYMYTAVVQDNKSLYGRFTAYYPIILLTFIGVRLCGWTHYNKGN